MRTKDEVLARIATLADNGDFFEFGRQVLFQSLDFESLRPFIADAVDLADIEAEYVPQFQTDAETESALRDYMAFAWGKVEDHRGLSASRSVEKLTAMVWMLGRDDIVVAIGEAAYVQYGAPKLRVICEAFGLPIPDGVAIERMMRGEPCRKPGDAPSDPRNEYCEEGCSLL